MSNCTFGLSALLVSFLTFFCLHPAPVKACAPAPSDGTAVSVASESAIIVWDAAHHTEHFIRRAEFQTQAKDFGFLVPTPTKPSLAQVSDSSFVPIEELIAPKVNTQVLTGAVFTSLLFPRQNPASDNEMATAAPTAEGVQLVSSQKVGPYDAVVLKADNAGALSGWLKRHGYAARPALTSWLAPYVVRHWYLTAFKIAQHESTSPLLSSAAVRMSFQAQTPFFPYSEPADQRGAGRLYEPRLLRVFLFDTHRVAGMLGQGTNSRPWPGQTAWTDAVPNLDRNAFARRLALPASQLPSNLWMTVFEDMSSPRMGKDDLYFVKSSSQSSFLPAPVDDVQDRRISIPVEPIVFLLIVFGFFITQHLTQPKNSIPHREDKA